MCLRHSLYVTIVGDLQDLRSESVWLAGVCLYSVMFVYLPWGLSAVNRASIGLDRTRVRVQAGGYQAQDVNYVIPFAVLVAWLPYRADEERNSKQIGHVCIGRGWFYDSQITDHRTVRKSGKSGVDNQNDLPREVLHSRIRELDTYAI